MHTLNHNTQVPVHRLEPDETGIRHFRVYNFPGSSIDISEFFVPHRKDHYLFIFTRKAGSLHWIDMTPYLLKDYTIYFTGVNNLIVKEEFKGSWSGSGIAFTNEFLSLQENASLSKLPVILNPASTHELLLTETDITFVEDMLAKINAEYQTPGEWQQRMLSAHVTTLLTYLSRLYTEQFKNNVPSVDKQLLKTFLSNVNECYRELREVSDYAARLNISAGHLSEVVKMQSGKPAIKHIHERQILEARRLLFHTNNSLKEIAFDLGFADASYFNRFFKRETGVPPAEYRAKIREMYH